MIWLAMPALLEETRVFSCWYRTCELEYMGSINVFDDQKLSVGQKVLPDRLHR